MSTSAEWPSWGRGADDWIAVQEPLHRPLYEALLDAVALPPGCSLLDAGCGSGIISLLAARRGLIVTGLDVSESFVDVARRRVPQASFIVGDLHRLPFEANSFDGLIGSNSYQFARDRNATMREATRVLRLGGRAAIAVFDSMERCEAARPIQTILSFLPFTPPGGAGPFALSADGQLEALMRSAGLALESVEVVDTPFMYPDRDTAVRAFMSAGPAAEAGLAVGEETLIAALQESLEPYRRADGSYRLNNGFKIGVGRKA